MTIRHEGLARTYKATAVVNPHRIVKLASENTALQAAAATDLLIGVSDSLGADAIGDAFDVILDGVASVVYGGNVSVGQLLTADASGKAVAAAPTAGANARVIGVAMIAGVADDIGSVLISQCSVQG